MKMVERSSLRARLGIRAMCGSAFHGGDAQRCSLGKQERLKISDTIVNKQISMGKLLLKDLEVQVKTLLDT